MTEIHTAHLQPARADTARHARDVLVRAAAMWAIASKRRVGAVVLPGDRSAAQAFDAFFVARRELAHHTGGRVAAVVAAEALVEKAARPTLAERVGMDVRPL